MSLLRIVLAVGLIGLAGCQSTPPLSEARRVKSPDEVANVFVSAYPAVPWADIASKLEPKHNLSTADARNMAAVATHSETSQFLSTFAVGLGLGLEAKSRGSSSSTAADGKTTITSTNNVVPGTVPTTSGVASTAITDSTITPGSSASLSGVDAATVLMAGTAVYQLAAILDNQLTKGLNLKDYEAYLVTFQVNLQPLARNLPYDTYINLSLIPTSWSAAVAAAKETSDVGTETAPVIIYPLVVADALESGSVGKSVETIRQAAFALSGLVNNIGVSAGLGGGSDKLQSIIGSDRNSLVTVGRINNSSLRIRIGAQFQGSSYLAMTPKTQNISVVVFVRAGEDFRSFVERITAVTRTEFYDAEKGTRLEFADEDRLGDDELAASVNEVLAENGLRISDEPACIKQNPTLRLLNAVDRGEYKFLDDCLENVEWIPSRLARVKSAWFHIFNPRTKEGRTPTAPTQPPSGDNSSTSSEININKLYLLTERANTRVQEILKSDSTKSLSEAVRTAEGENGISLNDIWLRRNAITSLLKFRVNSRESSLLVPLKPFPRSVALPDEEYLIFLKDNKVSTTAILSGAKNEKKQFLNGYLSVTADGQLFKLAPSSVSVNGTGDVVTLTFPSIFASDLMSSKLDPKTKKNILVSPNPITLTVSSMPQSTTLSGGGDKEIYAERPRKDYVYKQVRLLTAAPEPLVSPVKVASTLLVRDKDGKVKVQLNIGAWSAADNGDLYLKLSGAEVVETAPNTGFDTTNGGLLLKPESTLFLTLGNLSPLVPVELKFTANATVLAGSITLPVVP